MTWSIIAEAYRQIIPKRVCSECGSDKTQINIIKTKTGKIYHLAHWRKDGKGRYLCNRCSNRLKASTYARRKILFKEKRIYMTDEINRVGVCNWCRAVRPWDCKMTVMHHERYDDNNPLAHTIELCNSCHVRIPRIDKV